MTESKTAGSTRRGFLKGAGQAAAASALTGVAVPAVHAAGDDTIKIALVGCGGRGTGAAANALSVEKGGPIQLVAMADVFPDRLQSSYTELQKDFSSKMDVPEDRRFIGFDAYQKAMECLRPGDVVLLTTPPGFRWVHFSHAISRNLNTFMEKPITVDGPTTKRMMALGEEAQRKNLKVGVGLMCRHCDARKELFNRIQDGEIGEIITLRAYRQTGPVGVAFTERTPEGYTDLMWQVKRFHGFLWASGGCFSDFLIHNLDESCWMKDAWPVKAQASGGRLYRGDCIDQNFDHYSVEYTFADGTKLFLEGRNIDGCENEFASFAQGTRGSAVISSSSHTPAHCRIYDDHRIGYKKGLVWAYPEPEANPYQLEWNDLIDAIRKDKPYNEVKRGAEASLVASMGRMAAHTGRVITFDEMLNCEHEFAPYVDQLTLDSRPPIEPDEDGKYPIPMPGLLGKREY